MTPRQIIIDPGQSAKQRERMQRKELRTQAKELRTQAQAYPCRHRGQQLGERVCDDCGGTRIKAFACNNPLVELSQCIVRNKRIEGVAKCETCEHRQLPEHQASPAFNEWQFITAEQLAADAVKLAAAVPDNCRAIVGVARSGMIPAAIIATLRHLPLFELSHRGVRPLGAGSRGGQLLEYHRGDGPLFVVDDSVYGGTAMQAARKKLATDDAIFAAVYVRPEAKHVADVYQRIVPSPHLFAWNCFNNGIVVGNSADPRLRGGIAFDFDGVICEDPDEIDADEGPQLERYGNWLRNAVPKYLPRFTTIPLIVTFRLERWRRDTLDWLARHGASVTRLVMHPAATASERNRQFSAAAHKGATFRESACSLFVESCDRQAMIIHEVSNKPVLSIERGYVYR